MVTQDPFLPRKGKSRGKPVPFEFVLDQLAVAAPYTRPMFGCTAVYLDEKILFVLREKKTHKEDNGIWVATTREHHQSLCRDFPSLRGIGLFGKDSSWKTLPSDAPDFEEAAIRLCELAVERDRRLGKIPSPRSSSSRK
jgi:hypothetical protein